LRDGRRSGAAILAAALLVSNGGVSAHRLDECLQASRLAVEDGRIDLEVSLTPGVEVAEALIGDIDRDRDRVFSASEQQAFVSRVLMDLDVAHDSHPLDLAPGTATFPEPEAVLRGEGTIHIRSLARLDAQAPGPHHVTFTNRHQPDVSVYLANALVPASPRVAVTRQRHSSDQRELTIDYTLRTERSASMSLWLLGGVAVALAALLIRR